MKYKLLSSFVVLVSASLAQAGLTIKSHSVDNRQDGTAVLNVQFNHQPDYLTVANNGDRAESFQVEFYPGKEAFTTPLSEVLRFEEIDPGSGYIPIRDATGSTLDPDIQAGGWGEFKGLVPWETNGLGSWSFVIPKEALTLDSEGDFAYNAFTLNYGSMTDSVQGNSVHAVPLPPAAWAGLAMLGLLVLSRKKVAAVIA